jgi:hypothetical protein
LSPAEPWNLLDHPSWAWIRLARLTEIEPLGELHPVGEGVIFSTFEGEPPDIWPIMEAAAPRSSGAAAVAVGLLAASAVAFGLGQFLLRRGV